MLEPRRLAARAAAHRMAFLLSEPVGETVGYRVRAESRVSRRTRIEVVTEGILTRLIQQDPTLDGIGLVIVDEFHERSLNADLALALTLRTQRLLRPELRILIMSATLDGERVAHLLGGAPVVTSEGRAFPVDTLYLPPPANLSIGASVATAIRRALPESIGDVLAFLPGAVEIRQALAALADGLPQGCFVAALHGTMSFEAQDHAIAPAPRGQRKIVLATAIAETSLTIEGVRVVVDSGLARVARFSPASGMSRLETVRVTRATADQRRGRAGRVAAGTCLRLWHEHDVLLPFPSAEILDADLAPFALDLAVAGVIDPLELAWLDPPPAAALAQGRQLLLELEALDSVGVATAHGHDLARLGVHPRIGHMLAVAARHGHGALAADLGALLGDRDLLRGRGGPPPTDLRFRLDALRERGASQGSTFDVDRGAVHRLRVESRRLRRLLDVADADESDHDLGLLVALAYPERVALRRSGAAPRYVLRGGGAAILRDDDPLGAERCLAIAETDGRRPDARVFTAAPLDEEDLRRVFADQISSRDIVEWDAAALSVSAVRETRLGELVLAANALSDPLPDAVRRALLGAIRRDGLRLLPWTDAAVTLRQRLAFLHAHDASWPDVGDSALTSSLDQWLAAELAKIVRGSDVARIDVAAALALPLGRHQRQQLEQLAPTHVQVPTGSRIAIDYSDPTAPVLAVRLQEMFGCTEHPTILGGRHRLTLHLLSPAYRPVQVTRDLDGFWQSSYFDVRKDLRGRYPRHAWPDDPLRAPPTRHTKRRS